MDQLKVKAHVLGLGLVLVRRVAVQHREKQVVAAVALVQRAEVQHHGMQVEAGAVVIVVAVVDLPKVEAVQVSAFQ